MADPLSAITAVALAAHTLRRTCEFTQGILGAPSNIRTIKCDLDALQIVIEHLQKLLCDPRFTLAEDTGTLISLVQTPLQNCALLCDDIYRRIEPCVKALDNGLTSKWRGVARFKFRENETRAIQQDLASAKATLMAGVDLAQ